MTQVCDICGLSYEPEPVSDVCFENLCPLCRFSVAPLFEKPYDYEEVQRDFVRRRIFYTEISSEDRKEIERMERGEGGDDGWGAGR